MQDLHSDPMPASRKVQEQGNETDSDLFLDARMQAINLLLGQRCIHTGGLKRAKDTMQNNIKIGVGGTGEGQSF